MHVQVYKQTLLQRPAGCSPQLPQRKMKVIIRAPVPPSAISLGPVSGGLAYVIWQTLRVCVHGTLPDQHSDQLSHCVSVWGSYQPLPLSKEA